MTAPIDWVEDVCMLTDFMAASYNNKIYSIGGTVIIGNSTDGPVFSDSYLRIVDFSKPVNLSNNSIDIRTDNITTVIRLPDDIPRLEGATVLISDGVMHMLPGEHAFNNIGDVDGNPLNITTYRTNLTNKVWNFDLQSRRWDVYASGVDQAKGASVAFDAEKQIGWYYGGLDMQNDYRNGTEFVVSNGSTRALQDLYRLDRGNGAPQKVITSSIIVGNEKDGEMVYIQGVGKAGILVLIGGNDANSQSPQLRSMQTVHVFDIATNTWFAQPTTAEWQHYPTGLSEFCSVEASAEDGSSHNIYIYGGWSQSEGFGRYEVFVLTLPYFHWVRVYPAPEDTGNLDFRRLYKHRCEKIHKKHMVAYRGNNYNYTCDGDKGMKKLQGMTIYDMSSLNWTTNVELENQKYSVPQVLYEIIGGNATGNANKTEPDQGFQDARLAKIFSNETTVTLTHDYSRSKLRKGAISGGVVGGCFLIFLISWFFILRRRHRIAAATTRAKPQELPEECGLHELHNSTMVFELPSPPIELEGSVPKKLS